MRLLFPCISLLSSIIIHEVNVKETPSLTAVGLNLVLPVLWKWSHIIATPFAMSASFAASWSCGHGPTQTQVYQNSVNLWRAWLLLYIAYFTALHTLGSWLASSVFSEDALVKGLQNLITAWKHACDPNTKQTLLSCDIINKVVMKWGLQINCFGLAYQVNQKNV